MIDVVTILLLTPVAVWLLRSVIKALTTNTANARGIIYQRSKNPGMFWTTVVSQFLFFMITACVIAYLIWRLIS